MLLSVDDLLTFGFLALLGVFYMHILVTAQPDPQSEGRVQQIA